ncbi:MAG TPA: leucine-rich repeat domain-containing protein [Candidatus Lokiarchaeia archaeon]|nr:leucine-rich repeat domain-containing protein [Candidatus Lokiarchaeia archaeon]
MMQPRKRNGEDPNQENGDEDDDYSDDYGGYDEGNEDDNDDDNDDGENFDEREENDQRESLEEIAEFEDGHVLEARFPFLREGAFLVAQVDARTGRQRLLMQKMDQEGEGVEHEDAIDCIHVAVTTVPAGDLEDVLRERDFAEQTLSIRSSEELQEIKLAPEEKFKAFQSWVAGIAAAGVQAFRIQSEIEVEGQLAYPIASRLLAFATKIDPGVSREYLATLVKECQHEGVRHEASLIANLIPLAQYAEDAGNKDLLGAIFELDLPFPMYAQIRLNVVGPLFRQIAAKNECFLTILREYGENHSQDDWYIEELRSLTQFNDSNRLLEIIIDLHLPIAVYLDFILMDGGNAGQFLAIAGQNNSFLSAFGEYAENYQDDEVFLRQLGQISTVDTSSPILAAIADVQIDLPVASYHGTLLLSPECEALHDIEVAVNKQIPEGGDALGFSSKLGHIWKLNLVEQSLTSLPENFGNMVELRVLDLSHNQLSVFPEAISKVPSLVTLNLNKNRLTSLPESIRQLRNLHFLYVQDNLLSSLPRALGQMENLMEVHLQNNKIVRIPGNLKYSTAHMRIYFKDDKSLSFPRPLL